mgnify:CR=1 FL=1
MKVHHNQGSAVSAHGEKTGMSQGYLASVTYKNIKADRQNDVHQNNIHQVNIVRGQIKGKGKKKKQQHDCPDENCPAFEKLDVLIVIALHVHRITTLLLSAES